MEHDHKKFLGEHFCYEVEMLIFSIQRLSEANQRKEVGDINMSLETFLLHSRNLIEFFYFPPSKEYARAVDFISLKTWDKVRPPKNEKIETFLARANHEVSHLTYKRLYGDTNEKKWNWGEYFLVLFNITKVFLDNLPLKYCDAKIKNMGEILGDIMQRTSSVVK